MLYRIERASQAPNARRRVLLVAERLVTRLDHEEAVLEPGVLEPVRIELELTVPPTRTPGLAHPLRGVERGAVELVVPYEPPPRRRLRGMGHQGKGKHQNASRGHTVSW